MSLQQRIKELAAQLQEDVVHWRRTIHSNPELSFQEKETAAFIASILTKNGIAHTTGVAKTGVVGIIEGKNPSKRCIALRADMDALPIIELNEHNFCSKNEGVMHACGHDYHSASLLGTAIVLNEVRTEFEGTFKLIFQPSEEKMPGGASVMIEEGVLDNPKVDAILAQHVSPELATGTVGFCTGKFMASADEIYLTVKGKGGHAAFPEKLVDPVLIAAQILLNLQQVVSRKKSPFDNAVLSFGKVVANGATNIIPDQVKIDGTLRAMNEDFRKEAQDWIQKIAKQTAAAMGGDCDVNIVVGYPCLMNNDKLTEALQTSASEYSNQVVSLSPRMGAEDFAYYSQKVPACFYRIGTGGSEATKHGLHTPYFDVDESAFKTSVGLTAWLGIQALNQ